MTAKQLDILIEQGATFRLSFVWADSVKDSAGVIRQVPKDLTGCTARMQVRAGYGKTVMLSATTENGRISVKSDGSIIIRFEAALTDAAPLYLSSSGRRRVRRRAVYDLEVAQPDPDTRVDRVLQGRVTFAPNITRDAAYDENDVYIPNTYLNVYTDQY